MGTTALGRALHVSFERTLGGAEAPRLNEAELEPTSAADARDARDAALEPTFEADARDAALEPTFAADARDAALEPTVAADARFARGPRAPKSPLEVAVLCSLANVVRVITLTLVAALALACPKAGTDKAETATAAPSPAWWMSLKDGKLHRGLDEAPIGLYAAGDMQGERFVPNGDVEGAGPLAEAGTAGWLDLATGKFVDENGPKPPPPYIAGHKTPSGFSPEGRHITY